MNEDFCAFILTNGRPNNVKTTKTLRSRGYTGKIIYIVDDLDSTFPEYIKNFGSDVEVFSKHEVRKTTDYCDNFNNLKCILYARNVCFEIAEKLGYKYFIQLDDDYTDFRYKYNSKGYYGDWSIKNLDAIFDIMLKYFKRAPFLTIAMSQGGDFIGGRNGVSGELRRPKRKAMNSFICSTDRPFKFMGTINEDVNAYVGLGNKGHLLLTIPDVALQQAQTQSNAGGLTEMYLEYGTYVKSFYSVIINPSCVKINLMGGKFKRLHHKIKWNNAVPKIISEEFKK